MTKEAVIEKTLELFRKYVTEESLRNGIESVFLQGVIGLDDYSDNYRLPKMLLAAYLGSSYYRFESKGREQININTLMTIE